MHVPETLVAAATEATTPLDPTLQPAADFARGSSADNYAIIRPDPDRQ